MNTYLGFKALQLWNRIHTHFHDVPSKAWLLELQRRKKSMGVTPTIKEYVRLYATVGYSLEQIARMKNVTRERVRQVLLKAARIRNLRLLEDL